MMPTHLQRYENLLTCFVTPRSKVYVNHQRDCTVIHLTPAVNENSEVALSTEYGQLAKGQIGL